MKRPTGNICLFRQRFQKGAGFFLTLLLLDFLALASRPSVPTPLPDHPGNIYLEGESVQIRLPENWKPSAVYWRVLDDQGHQIRSGKLENHSSTGLLLGPMPIGWYRIEFLNTAGQLQCWTTAAVLARLKSPIPEDSPIAVDAAISWFAHNNPENQRRFANLAALAGVKWIRDRMRWREIEPKPGRFLEDSTYDSAARIQHAAGLRILQVFHDTPPWATEGRSTSEFAVDLRHVYRFAQAMARRFHGLVQAWEPWNEANVATFGGHTVDQMCSWQKAAWLGFKSEDPHLIVCWNVVTTVPTWQHTTGLLANHTWPYYDTYNIHSYDWAHSYLELWAPARVAACGRPMWVTEADRGIHHLGNAPWYDLSPRNARLKAEYLAQEYAQSLYAGAARHFHFILGNYQEPSGVQFGLLRKDFTPRPGYVALAAIGRFLAGAQCLGRWRPDEKTTVIAFRAVPDGKEHDVLVVWAERPVDWPQRGRQRSHLSLPSDLQVQAAYDYLGRPIRWTGQVGSAPQFLLLRPGTAQRLPLEPPPISSPKRTGHPSHVVLQAVFPPHRRIQVADRSWSQAYVYGFQPGETVRFKLRIYNFGKQPLHGTIRLLSLPPGWTVSLRQRTVQLQPKAMKRLSLSLRAPTRAPNVSGDGWITYQAVFSPTETDTLAFRVKWKK